MIVRLAGAPSLSELEQLCHTWEKIALGLASPFGGLFDLRGLAVSQFSARHRQLVSDTLNKLPTRIRTHYSCAAYVSDSLLLRSLRTGISWLAPTPWPVRYFADEPTARAWAIDQVNSRRRATPS